MTDRTKMHNPTLSIQRHGKQTDRQSSRRYHTGSKAWRQIRQRILIRDGYACVLCGRIDASNEVDHIDGDSSHNAASNLRTLCKPCHSRHGRQPSRRARQLVDVDGWPIE